MTEGWVILLIATVYLGGLFGLAYVGDRRADQGRSVINNPYIYTLSIAVYCTAWTYYGSVGRAAQAGLGFLPIYLGPTLMACLWWFVLRKMLRITKAYGITSIADFVASRYGKSALLGGLVTVIAVFGVMPYISLQLKAVSTSVAVILDYPAEAPFWRDLALFVALLLAAFSILFGTRHIDATEHHQGMVAAIAFESIVKLVAFVTVGLFVTFAMYDGFADIFAQARATGFGELLTFQGAGLSFADWFALTCLAAMAILFLPRQFQVAVIENINEDHLNKAIWLFPLYLLVINLFVLPIALAGRLRFPGGAVDADFMVLLLPMTEHQHLLTLFTFLGGLSAATAMVIVETVALSTMLCNDLIMPVLLRLRFLRLNEQPDLSGLLLAIRRGSILAMLLLGYAYFRMVGQSYALVTMGLVSFCAAAQFAPPILFGIYWQAATLRGALTGLLAGFVIWLYTLLLPALARSGWIDPGLLDGPFGLEILKPYALFGVSGLDPITHSLLWSLLANVAGLVGWSLIGRQGSFERVQASLFVEVGRPGGSPHLWRGSAAVADLRALLARYVGAERATEALARHARTRGLALAADAQADSDLVNFAERLLAGAIGAASARVMISTVVKSADFSPDEVMAILDEASQVIEYSRQLEQKSQALEVTSAELRRVNQRLTELDRLKDEFISTVSHELRTPLTSIRSFSEILLDNPELALAQRNQFLDIVVKESERLTRLINDILDMSRIASGKMEWHLSSCDPKAVIDDALAATSGLFRAKQITVEAELLASDVPRITVDRDRLMQVVINLLSNAAKFVQAGDGRVQVRLAASGQDLTVSVEDNGPGIPPEQQGSVFERFRQLGSDVKTGKPKGSGLGLSICRQIVEHFGGRIWIEPAVPRGSVFRFTLPAGIAAAGAPAAAAAGED